MDRSEAICLSCVNLFAVRPPTRKPKPTSPQLFSRRFNYFAKEHLNLPPTALHALTSAFTTTTGKAPPPPVFCGDCEGGLNIICNLFEGLCKVRAELANKVGQWAEKLEAAEGIKWGGGGQGEGEVLKELAGRMKLKGGEGAVQEIRKQIAQRCKQKAVNPTRLPPPSPLRRILPKLIPAPNNNANVTFVLTPGGSVSMPKQKTVQKASSSSASSSTSLPNKLNNRSSSSRKQEENVPSPPNSCAIIRTRSGVRIERPSKTDGTGSGSTSEHCDDSSGDGHSNGSGTSKNAAMEALQASLPRDLEVLEVDEPEPDESTLYTDDTDSTYGQLNDNDDEDSMINDVKKEETDSRGEYDEEPEEAWFGDMPEDDPLNISDAVDYPKPKPHSYHSSSASSSFPTFRIKVADTIMIRPKVEINSSFFDESDNVMDNYRTSQGDGSGDGMMLPVDVSIEEVDEGFSGQYTSPNESPRAYGGMIAGASGGNPSPPKRRKMAASGSTLDPSNAPQDIPGFVDFFKRRRKELGLTQSDVAKSLGAMYGHDDELFSQTTVSRFEAMNLSEKNMDKLRPLFQKWMEMADPDTSTVTDANPPLQRRRKRTTLDKEMIDALEEYFQQNATPVSDELSELAQQLNLEKEVVRVWFCNRRQREKKITSQSASGSFYESPPPSHQGQPTNISFQSPSPQPQYVNVVIPSNRVKKRKKVIMLNVDPSSYHMQ